jgi:hypothetical protein
MSLRYEQYRALHETRRLLLDIHRQSVKLEDLQERSYQCLRHYPFLDERGAPMFSQDRNECPVINQL